MSQISEILKKCYDVQAQLNAQLKRAIKDRNPGQIEKIMKEIEIMTDLPLFHSKGFSLPRLVVYAEEEPLDRSGGREMRTSVELG